MIGVIVRIGKITTPDCLEQEVEWEDNNHHTNNAFVMGTYYSNKSI